MPCGYHTGQCSHRWFPSVQNILSDSSKGSWSGQALTLSLYKFISTKRYSVLCSQQLQSQRQSHYTLCHPVISTLTFFCHLQDVSLSSKPSRVLGSSTGMLSESDTPWHKMLRQELRSRNASHMGSHIKPVAETRCQHRHLDLPTGMSCTH